MQIFIISLILTSTTVVAFWLYKPNYPIAEPSERAVRFMTQPIELQSYPADPKAAYRDGRAEAQKDIASGKIMLKTYGYPVEWSELYRSNLLSQYQIVSRPVAGCAVTVTLAENVRGYNEVSRAEIERRYGTGVLQRVAEETEKTWQQRQTNE